MIDETSQFFAILTNVGAAKQANADALGVPWKITEMGVGDANGTDPIPSATQTSLIHEWRRRPLNQLFIDPVNPAVIIAEQVIPADEGGYWIREIGLYDADGDLVAVANCAPSFKPILSQGSGRTQVVRMNFIVSSTGNITLKIDPSVVLATREFVERRILEELYKLDNKQSVRVATTANIALTGLPVIDGVSLLAGDRVLVKNQTANKDNGVYIAGAGGWQRAPDADSNAEVTSAMILSVEQGATLADTRWQLVTDGAIVLGATSLTFQNITQGFATINSPALVNPTANTPPQFDNTKALATTEYVMRSGGSYRGFTSLTSAATLTAAAVGTLVSTIGAFTVTLPASSALPSGSAIHFRNIGNGIVTVACIGGDGINVGPSQVANIALQPGATLELVSNGATVWWAEGSAQLQYSKVFGNTPAQFDNSKLLVTSEFVKRMGLEYGDYTNYAATATLTAADIGKVAAFAGAGAMIATLPTGPLIPRGAVVKILCGMGTVTVTTAAGDSVDAVNYVGNINMAQGDTAEFIRIGSLWRLIGGSVSLKYSALMSGSNWITQPQFDNTKSIATTEFVQREKGSFASSAGISGGIVTLTAAHVGTRIEMSANGTLTLPKSSTLPKGSSILITTSSAVDAAKLALVAGDTLAINNVSVSSPYTMSMGSDILLVSDGEKWRAHASLECLRSSPLFAAIFGANGHQVLPSGWTFKIGHASTDTASGTVPVTFPVAFPNACMYVGAMYAGASGAPNPSLCQCSQPTRTGFTGFMTSVVSNVSAVTVGGFNWLAIGY